MDDSLDEIFFFRCGHCQRQQWGYYVTARWLAYRKHYLVRDTIVPRVQSKDSPPLHKGLMARSAGGTDRQSGGGGGAGNPTNKNMYPAVNKPS